jgi:protein tyrosine phosphatase (PTP) superfamily phosphohydrolase (DUF442 family)
MVAILFVTALILGAVPTTQEQAQVPPIRNFLQVNTEFCTGGQPRVEHYAMLKEKGVKAVLNLRQPTEHRADEEKQLVEELGLKYFNVPVNYQNPTAESVDEFLKITDDKANRPMFVHCTAAIRVGAFWTIRRVVRDGLSWEAALEEGKKVGLANAPHLEEFARNYIATHKE